MRKLLMLVVLVLLAFAGAAVGGSVVAGAAGTSASGARASGGDEASAARRLGRRGRRGRRGSRGPAGPAGPQGPPGPPGGAPGTSGGVVPIEFRGNAGTPLQLLFLYGGVQLEMECASATRGARIRSVAENGLAMANFDIAYPSEVCTAGPIDNFPSNRDNAEVKTLYQTADSDFDNNDRIDLSGQATAPQDTGFFKGFFAFSGAPGTVVTGVYITSIAYATAQGDCVFVANLNRD